MLKQPLFGQDSSPHITSMCISSLVTLICWIIFCILCLVVKFKPQTSEYKEIQIVLDSTPVVEQPVEEQSVSAEQQSAVAEQEPEVAEPVEAQQLPNPVETPVAEAKVEAPKKTPAPAKIQTKNETPKKEYQKVEYELVKSVEEQMAEQMSIKKQSSVPDWWNEDTPVTEQQAEVSKTPEKVLTQSGMTGTSAQGSSDGNQLTGKKGGDLDNKDSSDSPPSELTEQLLKKIKNATYSSETGNSKSVVILKSTNASDGKTVIAMDNGTVRTLYKPSEPRINLSENASKEITNTIGPIKIRFRVLSEGNIPRGEIEVENKSLFTSMPTVYKEILDQISKWIFEPGDSAYATFVYTIEKK